MTGILVLDVGNTRVKARRMTAASQWPAHPDSGGGLSAIPLENLGTAATPRDDRERETLTSWLGGLPRGNGDPVVLVTVVPGVVALVRKTLPETIVVDHTRALPFVLAVDDPSAVGPDRYCNMAAAHSAGLTDALVIDAGTATTFDLLAGGVYIGGIIAPGLARASEARPGVLLVCRWSP